ncbi:MAG: D-aminoacylase [Nitrospiraceae bacterium]|nr:D-aminoacylase [Nitrospiraceae bacterium]
MDYLLKGGFVIDGTGTAGAELNVGIKDGLIRYIGNDEPSAENVINISGYCAAPGFIDAHAHSEFTLMADGRAEAKISQGVTTEINGNCGLSAGPLLGHAAERRENDMREYGIKERWSTLGEYFNLLGRKGTALNFSTLCGHGNIRASVMGYSEGRPDPEQMAAMKKLALESVADGAIGMSSGLIYPPGIFSDTDEIAELCRVFSASGGIYTSHMRSEGDMLLESMQEMMDAAMASGIRMHVSHIKTYGKNNWHKVDAAIDMLNKGLASGMKITCDRYPYTAAGTDLDAILPKWVHEGGVAEELRRLGSVDLRPKIEAELRRTAEAAGGDYWQGVVVSTVADRNIAWMEGKSISDISLQLGKRPEQALVDIVLMDQARTAAIFFVMCEENLKKFLSLPFAMIGSDSSARSFSGPTRTGTPHPRAFGSFPRFLGKYVRDEKLLSLEEAVRRITSLPAETFGLHNRGLLKQGCHADIVVFDPGAIADTASYTDPFAMPVGISHVFVNGIPALEEGAFTGKLAGRILKHRTCRDQR